MLTDEELNAIEARANAATDGAWRLQAVSANHWDVISAHPSDIATVLNRNNAAFIAHARRDVPVLLAHIRELKRMFVSESLKCTVCGNEEEQNQ
jgi:hypothetical protein